MRCSDLKRAVEDVVLRPDENRLAELQKRGTIAALDLCQVTSPTSTSHNNDSADICATTCSCSSDFGGASTSSSSANTNTNTTVTTSSSDTNRPPPPLCASSSLDAIMTSSRPQPSLFNRHSASGSRRQSRVFSNSFASKRKRSNSLTNYNKGQSLSVSLPPSARHTPHRFVIASDEEAAAYRSSLASSDSHSSVAEGFVLEEEEQHQHQHHQLEYSHQNAPPSHQHQHHSPCSSTSSSFTTYRQPKQLVDYDDDMMDCD